MSDSDPPLSQVSVEIAPGPLGAPILGRVVGMLAARADCPIDRLDDALLVADAVAAEAASFSADGRIAVDVCARPGNVELLIGPLRAGGADGLVASAALPGIGNVLERVADRLEREQPDGIGEDYLRIGLGFDARREPPTGTMERDVP